jgi:hypothetical protein
MASTPRVARGSPPQINDCAAAEFRVGSQSGWRRLARRLVARTWTAAKREDDEITGREVTLLLADFTMVWDELFPAEQARIVQHLVERVEVQENALEVRIRAEGLVSLVGELRQQGERKAA